MRIADLEARSEANRAADRRYAAAVEESGLPSGSTGYRHLADYELEMKELALRYPSMVKPLTLNHKSVLGRDVNGIEIARNAAIIQRRQADLPQHGRPPRPRVAVVGARDRVGVRPAGELRRRRTAPRGS